MRDWLVKHAIALVLSLVCCTSLAFSQGQKVYECSHKRMAKVSVLQKAIEKSTVNNPAIEFLTESSPCDHTKSIVTALDKTLNKRVRGSSFKLALNHSF